MKNNQPPSEQMRKRLFELLDGTTQSEEFFSELIRHNSERFIQKFLEEEVTEFLGRKR